VTSGNAHFFKADAPIEWKVADGDTTNFYKLTAATGNMDICVDSLLHLNKGGEYVVISYTGDTWYPDYCPDVSNYNWAFCKKADVELYMAKIDFYALINKAITTLADTQDASLKAAIAEAEGTYTSATSVDAITEASTKLESAISDFNVRTKGDMTTLLANPSFEDLSAQDGSTTSNVAHAPVGWNILINGVLCNTIDSIKSAGINNWCGVNADGDAATKTGNYVFGIWTANIPEFEISQTVSGLKNGTYLVGCDIMGGSNSSGSRLTTQRVFAGVNSCYFGHEDSYSEANLSTDENYTFAGHDEILGDAVALQTCTTSAYVFNGKLTLGLRTNGVLADGTKGNGGQGWFKVDNFTLAYKGLDLADAKAALSVYIKKGEALADGYMQQSVTDQLADAVTTSNKLVANASATAADLDAALANMDALIPQAKSSMSAYTKFRAALDDAESNINLYGNYTGAADYSDAYTEWSGLYEDKSVNVSQIDSLLTAMKKAADALKLSGVVENQDITSLITNPSFETGDYTGWTLTTSALSWCGVNGDGDLGKTGTYIFGIWNNPIPEFEISQTITGLKGGYYTVTCDLMGASNSSGSRMTTQRLFVNNCAQYFGNETDYNTLVLDSLYPKEKGNYTFAGYAEQTTENGPFQHMSVKVGIGTGDPLTFGIRTSGNLNAVNGRAANSAGGDGWFKVDNFTLTCNKIDEAAGVNSISGGVYAKSLRVYGVDGSRRSSLTRGLNIVSTTMSDGTVKVHKVIVK
jgi:hypothetical protein